MKVKDLIGSLKAIEEVNPDSTVYLTTEKSSFDFTGFDIDDLCDVSLYVVAGNKEA